MNLAAKAYGSLDTIILADFREIAGECCVQVAITVKPKAGLLHGTRVEPPGGGKLFRFRFGRLYFCPFRFGRTPGSASVRVRAIRLRWASADSTMVFPSSPTRTASLGSSNLKIEE